MLLAVDVGNTTTKLGVYDGEHLRTTWQIATVIHRLPDECGAILLNLLRHQDLQVSDIKEVSMCSVVPPVGGTLTQMFDRYFHVQPLVVGVGVKTGVRIRMDNPREVGPDRIVHAAAAHHLFHEPVIVVDLGTATTFDAVSAEGDYLGGAIAPGILTAAEALVQRTSLLPRIDLVRPKQAIGTNTIAAMHSGIVFGYAGLIEGVVARIRKELDPKARVIATGGYAELIAKETTVIDLVDTNLTLNGLRLVYMLNKG